MKLDAFSGEKEILSFSLPDGSGWLTTHRLILQREKQNPRVNVKVKQPPEMYFLKNFEKAEIEGETLIVHFKGWQTALISLTIYSPSLLKEIKDYVEEASKYC